MGGGGRHRLEGEENTQEAQKDAGGEPAGRKAESMRVSPAGTGRNEVLQR